jgi:hypothetical protein
MEAGTDRTLFRSYSDDTFIATGSWRRLQQILTGNGGAYGLYGPRGSGKSWLMRRAIQQAEVDGGMGLWFPCPSGYDTAAFLSALSDNLANEVEQRYIRNEPWWATTGWLWWGFAIVVVVTVAATIVSLAVAGLTSTLSGGVAVVSVLWTLSAFMLMGLSVLGFRRFVRGALPTGRLAREATALRERIRYTTALKQGSEVNVTGGSRLTGTLRRTREKDLDERPTTVASLVFDFRRLASAIVATTGKSLVIGIDELDKIDDREAARSLLRDIKGIFEIHGAFFLVSVSEEAATDLRLGTLHGRNEFNSSFYTVIEMPLLDPVGVSLLMNKRGAKLGVDQEIMLCLLSVGNWREAIRLADQWDQTLRMSRPDKQPTVDELARQALAAEAVALLEEVVRAGSAVVTDPAVQSAADLGGLLATVWKALPASGFMSQTAFNELSESAIQHYWDLLSLNRSWPDAPVEAWRRFLIRLFVVGQVLPAVATLSPVGIADLCSVLVMAGRSSLVAQLMLGARFGDDLKQAYTQPPGPANLLRLQSGSAPLPLLQDVLLKYLQIVAYSMQADKAAALA